MEEVKSRELIEDGFKCCKEFLGGSWVRATKDNFAMTQITGGLSNNLYKCSLKDNYPVSKKEQRHVLMRIYGEIIFESPDAVLNDSVTYTLLAERNLGPKLYGIFSRGRLEQYVPSRVLNTSELHHPSISRACARIMCRFHQLTMPMNKQPRWLFDTTQRYLKEVLALIDADQYVVSHDLDEEYKQLKELLCSIKSPVVFCHNDLQEGNILYIGENAIKKGVQNGVQYGVIDGVHYTNGTNKHKEEEKDEEDDGDYPYDHVNEILRPIDFEYSSYNYRGFDIGNHFCEWCYNYHHSTDPYFKADLSAYPDKKQQMIFIREYLREKKEINDKNTKKEGRNEGVGEGKDEEVEAEEDIEGLLLEANAFALASHFLWYLWSVVQSKKSTIKFGYMEYSQERLQAYISQKPTVIKMLQDYNSKKNF